MRSRAHVTDALLLRAADYGEADRIVTLLTRDLGKASFIARSARRSKKRFAGALEPFNLLSAELSQGRGQLGTLAQAQVTRSFPRIVSDLGRISAGFAGLELVRELCAENQPDEGLFGASVAFLQALDMPDVAAECLLLAFETQLLALVGFAPRFDRCGICGKQPRDDQAGLFDQHQGHLVCRGCGGAAFRLGPRARGALMQATRADWQRAAELPWTPRDIGEARAALRAFIEHRIGHALTANSLLAPAPK